MIVQFFDKLRQKSEGYRKSFAFSVSLGVTLLILIFWLGIEFGIDDKKIVKEKNQSSFFTPFESIGKDVASVILFAKNSFRGFGEIIYIATTTPSNSYEMAKDETSEIGSD